MRLLDHSSPFATAYRSAVSGNPYAPWLGPIAVSSAQGGAVYLDASKHAQREGVRALRALRALGNELRGWRNG